MSPVVRWMAPDLTVAQASAQDLADGYPADAPDMPPEPLLQPPTLEEVQAIQDAARQEGLEQGHAEGHAEGLAQGQAEVRRLVAQIEGILDNFSRPLLRLEGEVVAALGELSVRVAGQLLGRAYQAEPALLQELVNEALEAVGGSNREVEVRLHPDDIAALAPLLKLAPGDLRVHAESVRIDGTLEARLRAALSTVMRKAGASQ